MSERFYRCPDSCECEGGEQNSDAIPMGKPCAFCDADKPHAWHDDGSYNIDHAAFLDYWVPTQGSAEKNPAPDPDRRPLDLMERARAIVYGARQEAYGHPADDYTRTAGMWSAFLGIPITPEQAALMMVLLKISRERNRPGDDNIVDAHGYLLCYGRIRARQRQVIEAH